MGRNHARVLSKLSEVNFLGVVDPRLDTSLDSPYKVHKSVEQLLLSRVDYCVVSVPTIHHESVSLELISAGVHVLIEKPISESLESAEDIKKCAIENNVVAAVGHIERFNSAAREAKKRIREGQLGAIYQISTRRQGPFPSRISDVGVVKDLATHDIDLTRWITEQNYRNIGAFAAFRSGRNLEDLIAISAITDSNVVVNHLVNWISPLKERSVIITGENGAFQIDTLNSDLTFYENGQFKNTQTELAYFHGVSQGDIHKYAFPKPEPLVVEHENFRDAILGRDSEVVSLQDGIETLRIAESAIRSYRTGVVQSL